MASLTRMSRPKPIKPERRELLRLQVLTSRQLSPNVVRVTFGGDDLHEFTPMGRDQWFRTFLPQPGHELRLPSNAGGMWFARWMLMGRDTKPLGRSYTVRAHRAAGAGHHGASPELDVDFVLHDGGAAADWARAATPGDEVGILNEGVLWNPVETAAWHLLVGDESAMPAILGILRDAPRDLRGHAYLEIPHADDAQPVDAPAGLRVHWVVRGNPEVRPGWSVADVVTATELPRGAGYAYLAGHESLVAELRRHLVARGVPTSHITFTGYWR